MIESKIVADSINKSGNRITTYLLTYPRFIHADFMTHRVFSRNASSSRARPIEKVIEEAELTPALPIYWGKNQRGMQAAEELEGMAQLLCKLRWNDARVAAIEHAKALHELGLHKQLVNRILEPFTHITVLCTATDYGNFFNLRAHPDAMPELQELAFQMLTLYMDSEPKLLNVGDWHLPFADRYLTEGLTESQLLKIVTARAARLSYLTFDGNISHDKDYELHDRLAESGHWSPFEHAALALDGNVQCGNFVGYKQYRKFFSQENRREFNQKELFKQRRGVDYAKQNNVGKMDRPVS